MLVEYSVYVCVGVYMCGGGCCGSLCGRHIKHGVCRHLKFGKVRGGLWDMRSFV